MGSRADSIIIAHIPATHDRVYLISIPRDTNAAIPAVELLRDVLHDQVDNFVAAHGNWVANS